MFLFDGGGFLGGATFISPLSLGGCSLWLDFSDSSTVHSSTVNINQIDDKSGNGRHFSSTSTNRPRNDGATINGLATADFDGTNDTMTSGVDLVDILPIDAFTAFLVFSIDSFANDPTIFGDNSLKLEFELQSSSSRVKIRNNDGSADEAQVSSNSTATPYLFTFRHEGGNIYIARNAEADVSTASGDTSSPGSATISLPVPNGFNGQIGEMVCYNRALSSAEIADVRAYLNKKWNLY